LMPHPERACELALGSADGLVMFQSVLKGVGSHLSRTLSTSSAVNSVGVLDK
jgi:hypothetical protein